MVVSGATRSHSAISESSPSIFELANGMSRKLRAVGDAGCVNQSRELRIERQGTAYMRGTECRLVMMHCFSKSIECTRLVGIL